MNLKKIEEIVQSIDITIQEKDIFLFLKNRKRWPYLYPWGQPSIEIINNNGMSERDVFFKIDSYLDYEAWKKLYDLGFTSVISNVLDLNEELRLLQKNLQEEIGSVINGNFYFSKPGQLPSFSEHSHDYDVIVKQIYGQSTWLLNKNKLIIKDKQTCIIPKNTLHQVIEKDNKKLSLTLNIK